MLKFCILLSTVIAISPFDQEKGEPCIPGTTVCDFKNGACCTILVDGVENTKKDYDKLDYKTWCVDTTADEVTLVGGPGTTWKFTCAKQ